jgi:hypothetical protein
MAAMTSSGTVGMTSVPTEGQPRRFRQASGRAAEQAAQHQAA